MNSQSLLDEMVNEDSVRILKAAIPYLPSKGQSFVCIFAKFLELQNTFKLLHSSENAMQICAKEMVYGGLLEAKADIGISATGFAGPSGGWEAPVGTVFIGCGFAKDIQVREYHLNGSRSKVREEAVACAICQLYDYLSEHFEHL